MKNLNLDGRVYELAPDTHSNWRLPVRYWQFLPRPGQDVSRSPCIKSDEGNDGRGSFVVIKEVSVDTPTPTVGDTSVEVLAPGQSFGRKDDNGKLDMTLLDDMPRAIKAVVEVMQWAITDKKPVPYERGSWLGVHPDRYRAAILRHWRDGAEQAHKSQVPAREQRDKETELLHLAHIATSALMALENTLRELEAQRG